MMKNKIIFYSYFWVLMVFPVGAIPLNNEALDQLVLAAKENNRDLKVASYDVDLAKNAIDQSKTSFLPQVFLNAERTKQQSFEEVFTDQGDSIEENLRRLEQIGMMLK